MEDSTNVLKRFEQPSEPKVPGNRKDDEASHYQGDMPWLDKK